MSAQTRVLDASDNIQGVLVYQPQRQLSKARMSEFADRHTSNYLVTFLMHLRAFPLRNIHVLNSLLSSDSYLIPSQSLGPITDVKKQKIKSERKCKREESIKLAHLSLDRLPSVSLSLALWTQPTFHDQLLSKQTPLTVYSEVCSVAAPFMTSRNRRLKHSPPPSPSSPA